ncbi:cytochrome c biogenesis protein CcdA, partial [Methylobacterium trifolii]
AASLLASRAQDLGSVGLTMLVFGLGAALPLVVLGTLSRAVLVRWRNRMMGVGKGLKAALGLLLVATGAAILLGYDKALETTLVNASPQWLTDLTTRL